MVEFVSVAALLGYTAEEWNALSNEKDLVITSNREPIALLIGTTASTFEVSLAALRQARAQLAVEAMQHRARETGAHRMTLAHTNAEIAAARRTKADETRPSSEQRA